MVYKGFDKKSTLHARSENLSTRDKSASSSGVKSEIMSNRKLAEELHKLIIRKFQKLKVNSSFIDNIWGTDLANIPLISKFNKGSRFLLYLFDIFSKYVWTLVLKGKKGITITNAFQNVLDQSNLKPNIYGLIKAVNFTIDQ